MQVEHGTPDPETNPMNDFLRGYLETALDYSTDDDGAHQRWTMDQLSPGALAQATAECAAFESMNASHLEAVRAYLDGQELNDTVDATLGYLFWLSRNGHGHGFHTYVHETDGDQEAAFQALQEGSEFAAERELYAGDDGALYFSPEG